MPRGPERGTVLGPGREPHVGSAEIGHHLGKAPGVFRSAGLGAVELHEQMRALRQLGAGIGVDRAYRVFVDELDPRHRDAHLDHRHHRVDRGGDFVEGADAGRHRLRLALELDGEFGDDPERAFGAHEQPGEVVARGRLAGGAAGADHPPIGEHHFEREDVFPDRPVTHRGGAGGAGRGHAAERGIGAGIDREEQPRRPQFAVEVFAGEPGLDDRLHVALADLEHPVHPGEIERDAAPDRAGMALERGAGTEGDHGAAVGMADGQDARHLLGGLGKGDGVGRGRGEMGLGGAMGIEIRLGPAQPIA